MENILTKYLKNPAHTNAFTFLEQELVRLIKVTVEHNQYIVIKKSLLNRLATVEPELLALKNIFTFNSKLSDMLTRKNPISAIIPIKERQLIKLGLKESENYYNHQKYDELPIYSFRLSTISEITNYLSLDPNDPKNHQFISHIEQEILDGIFTEFRYLSKFPYPSLTDRFNVRVNSYTLNHNLFMDNEELVNEYWKVVRRANIRQMTKNLAIKYVEEVYISKIHHTINPILREISEHKIEHLLGIFLDIANLNNKELAQFTTGYYTYLPYFPRNRKPTAAIYRQTANLSDGITSELLIRNHKQLIHVVYNEFGKDTIVKFDKYHVGKGENFTFDGFSFDIDDSFLKGDNLTTLEMNYYDSNEVKIFKDFRFNKQAVWELAMSGTFENSFTLYLQDRSKMHHRQKR
ncbi:hypothetical protein [Pseudomonas putida]|uniref:hypothetical protein n=1 Tax=Pseudomonas putida TaxID=303 RepID=UPI0037C57CED